MQRTLRGIYDKLALGGYLLGTFASTNHSAREVSRREAEEGLAQRLEPDTYVRPRDTVGDKALVHHYTTERELRDVLLADFEVVSLEEKREGTGGGAHWVVLARKEGDTGG